MNETFDRLSAMLANIANELNETEDFYAYFEDVLDFEYTINSRKNYRGVKVWLTLGGPNIWINTVTGELRGAWGAARDFYPLPAEIIREIDSVFQEYYNC